MSVWRPRPAPRACPLDAPRRAARRVGPSHVVIDSDISPLALKGRRAAAKILSRFSQLPVRAARRRSREERPFLPRGL